MDTTERLTTGAVEALEARGLEPQAAAMAGMYAQQARNGGGDVLVIPFLRDGAVVNRKYRTLGPDKKFWQDAGGTQCFWNEDCLRDEALHGKPLVITEGEMDALAAIQCGFTRTVSVPGGAPDKPIGDGETSKYDFLEEARPLLKQPAVEEIILAVDGDAPGAALLHDLSLRLGRFRCKFVTYPKDPRDPNRRLKDLNEVLVHYGRRGVEATLNRAQWIRVDGVYRMSELPPVPDAPIYDIAMDGLREHYKLRLGDLAVWTGVPSHGKSSLVNDVCCRVARMHELNVAFASFEQMPQRDHRRNLRTWYLGKPTNHCDTSEMAKADAWIDRHFSFIVGNEDEDVTLDWLLDRLEVSVVQHGSKVVVIDPWNELDHSRERNESITEYTGRAIKTLRRFARKMMVHLIIVAHPSKQQKNEDGHYQMPTLYDISDSAHWYNKADLGVVVHRYDDHTRIRVAKSRYHDIIGIPGEVKATFEFEKRRFNVWT